MFQGFSLSTSSPTCCFRDCSHPSKWEVLFHFDVEINFPKNYSAAMCTPISLEKCLFRFSAHFYLSSVSFYVCTRFLKNTPSSYHSLISYDLQITSSTPCLIYSLSSLCPLLHNLKFWWNQFIYFSFCYLSFSLSKKLFTNSKGMKNYVYILF